MIDYENAINKIRHGLDVRAPSGGMYAHFTFKTAGAADHATHLANEWHRFQQDSENRNLPLIDMVFQWFFQTTVATRCVVDECLNDVKMIGVEHKSALERGQYFHKNHISRLDNLDGAISRLMDFTSRQAAQEVTEAIKQNEVSTLLVPEKPKRTYQRKAAAKVAPKKKAKRK